MIWCEPAALQSRVRTMLCWFHDKDTFLSEKVDWRQKKVSFFQSGAGAFGARHTLRGNQCDAAPSEATTRPL